MKKTIAYIIAALFFVPSVSLASTLSQSQVNSIVSLLEAFNVSQVIVSEVESALTPSVPLAAVAAPTVPLVPRDDGVYGSSSIGYDLSYATNAYPAVGFGFAVVGVTHGKAFTKNERLATEFSWAKFGSAAAPTLYMNLNAPYGSAVAGHITTPQPCPSNTSISAEPSACEGYNYGFNAAQAAYSYASSLGASSPLWWLDIEEANSWSATTTVNDATIQGAIDYLNKQNIRVGIYSVPYMWNDIAGNDFIPKQTINGSTVTIPNWKPIGITNLIGASNHCVLDTGFIPHSPIWIVQYEANSTAIDQNYAC